MVKGMKIPSIPRYLEDRCLHRSPNIPAVWPWPYRPPRRPMAHSTHVDGTPIRISATKYGIMKAPPPFWAAWTGKRRKFPMPMAFPARARINPILVPHVSRRLPPSMTISLHLAFGNSLHAVLLRAWHSGRDHPTWVQRYRRGTTVGKPENFGRSGDTQVGIMRRGPTRTGTPRPGGRRPSGSAKPLEAPGRPGCTRGWPWHIGDGRHSHREGSTGWGLHP